jgi:hypothetical protein
MKTGNCGEKRENAEKNDNTKRAGKYGNEEGTVIKEGRERLGGEMISVPAHIFGVNPDQWVDV